jgi:hypothetical protein
MSIQQNFPAITPSLSLNFARSKTLDPRITFSRTSTATRVNEQGLVEVVSADIPRFDHSYDPVSGTVRSLGLLVEEQSTNSLLYSNDFTQLPVSGAQDGWFKQNSHPVPTQDVIGPDGVSGSGWRFYRTSTNQYIYQQVVGAGTHTLSAWVRSEEATGDFRMSAYNATNGTMQTSFTATNEWRRFNITISPTVNTNYYPCIPTNTNKNFYVYGAQLELNKSFPTSYIPRDASTATRSPDNVSMVGENFSSWYNQSEGTVYADTNINGVRVPSFNRLWSFTNSNFNLDGLGFYSSNSSTSDGRYGISGSINGISIYSPNNIVAAESVFDTPRMKSCFGFVEGGNCNISFNGVLPNTNGVTATDFPNVDRFLIGQPQRFQGHSCMTISQLTYYPRRLSNDNLQNLTK